MAQKDTSEHGPLILEGPDRGVDSRAASTKLPAGAYAMLRNLELVTDLGSFSIRKGTKQLTTSSLGSGPVRAGIRWYYGSTPTAETLFVWGTGLYRLIGAATSPTSLGSLGGSDVDRTLIPYIGPGGAEYVLVGSISTTRRYEPTAPAIRAAGFPAPGSAPTAASGGAGVLVGDYRYKVTFGYDGSPNHNTHESSASATSNTFTASSNTIALSAIPTGGTGCSRRTIYRTKAGGELWYQVGTIDNNTATTFNDNVADDALLPNQAPTDNGAPPTASHWASMKGRIYALDVLEDGVRRRGRLRFSAIASTERNPNGTVSLHGAGPEIWPSTYYIDIGDVNGEGTGLQVQGDTLQIFLGGEIHLLRDNGASDMNVWKIEGAVGCIAPRSIVDMGNLGTFFLGRVGTTPMVYRLIGQKAYPVSGTIDSSSGSNFARPSYSATAGGTASSKVTAASMGNKYGSIEPTMRSNVVGTGSAAAVKPQAIRYRDQYLLSYAYQLTPSVLYETAKYDPGTGRWTFDRGYRPACWIPALGAEDAGELWFGHADQGWIVRYDIDGGDFDHAAASDPANAQMYIETDWLDMGRPHQRKQLKSIYIVAEVQAGATITVERRRDFNASGSSAGCTSQAMTATVSGTQIFAFRIEGVFEGGTSPDIGFHHKLVITVDVPYATVGEAFKPVRIHGISVYYEEIPPDQHVGA